MPRKAYKHREYRYNVKHQCWQYLGWHNNPSMIPLEGDQWFAVVTEREIMRFDRETLLHPAIPADASTEHLLRASEKV